MEEEIRPEIDNLVSSEMYHTLSPTLSPLPMTDIRSDESHQSISSPIEANRSFHRKANHTIVISNESHDVLPMFHHNISDYAVNDGGSEFFMTAGSSSSSSPGVREGEQQIQQNNHFQNLPHIQAALCTMVTSKKDISLLEHRFLDDEEFQSPSLQNRSSRDAGLSDEENADEEDSNISIEFTMMKLNNTTSLLTSSPAIPYTFDDETPTFADEMLKVSSPYLHPTLLPDIKLDFDDSDDSFPRSHPMFVPEISREQRADSITSPFPQPHRYLSHKDSLSVPALPLITPSATPDYDAYDVINNTYMKNTDRYLNEVPELEKNVRKIIYDFALTCHTCFKKRGQYLCTEHQIPSDDELDDGKGWDFYYECAMCFDKSCCGRKKCSACARRCKTCEELCCERCIPPHSFDTGKLTECSNCSLRLFPEH